MKRVIPGLLIAGCWLLLLLKGSFLVFWLVLIAIAYLSGLEYVKMVFSGEIENTTVYCFPILLILPVVSAGLGSIEAMSVGLLTSFLLLAVYVLWRYENIENAYHYFSRAVFGAVYIGFLTAHLVLLHHLENGNLWIIILSAITAGSDTGAYYIGRLLGKHKLCPNVSPKKTIEGAVGGLFGGVVFALGFGWLLMLDSNYLFLFIASLMLVVVGIGGDLTESILKRANNIKDSGKLLAGHGGVLDRVDSILFAGPTLYYLLMLV